MKRYEITLTYPFYASFFEIILSYLYFLYAVSIGIVWINHPCIQYAIHAVLA